MQITANHFFPLTFTEKYFSKVFGLYEAERSFKSKIKTDKLRLSLFSIFAKYSQLCKQNCFLSSGRPIIHMYNG